MVFLRSMDVLVIFAGVLLVIGVLGRLGISRIRLVRFCWSRVLGHFIMIITLIVTIRIRGTCST